MIEGNVNCNGRSHFKSILRSSPWWSILLSFPLDGKLIAKLFLSLPLFSHHSHQPPTTNEWLVLTDMTDCSAMWNAILLQYHPIHWLDGWCDWAFPHHYLLVNGNAIWKCGKGGYLYLCVRAPIRMMGVRSDSQCNAQVDELLLLSLSRSGSQEVDPNKCLVE